jgi:hypothetical protein
MKKIILLLSIAVLLASCSLSNDQPNFEYKLLPVTSVVVPTQYAVDSITNITLKYKRPSSCYYFNNFYYKAEGFERTVAIEAMKSLQNDCTTDNETLYEVNLKFKPSFEGVYHFKFWTGANSSGVDEFLEYDVDVNH